MVEHRARLFEAKLIENLHVLNAERVVAMAKAIRDMESAAG